MTPFTIYLWQQADKVGDFFSSCGHFLVPGWFLAVLAFSIFSTFPEDDVQAFCKRALRVTFLLTPLPPLVLMVAALIPSSKTIAMMVAIPAIANSEPIQKDIPELYQLAKEALKEQIVGGKTK